MPRTTTARPRGGRRRSVAGFAFVALALALPACDGGAGAARARVRASLARLDGMALVADRGGPAFFIDRFEVTNARYAEFVRGSGYLPARREGYLRAFRDDGAGLEPEPELVDHPVVFVSCDDARAYARFRDKELPTAQQWERVAAAVSPRRLERASLALNCAESGIGATTCVGTFPSGATLLSTSSGVVPQVFDLYGNVWEWTITPGSPQGTLIACGGAFNQPYLVRQNDVPQEQVFRSEDPGNRNLALGFRCVVNDAEGVIDALIADLALVDDAERADALERLARFGEPLARIVRAKRFDAAVIARAGTGGGDDDLLVPLQDGAFAVLNRDGVIRVIDARDGTVRAEAGSFAEFYHARAADLDQDGVEELYVGTRPRPPPGRDVEPFSGLMIVLEAGTRRIVLVDARSGVVQPYAAFAPEAPELALEALGLDADQLALSELAAGIELRPAAADGPGRGFVLGFLPRYEQDLYCLDARTLETRWHVRTPYSDQVIPFPDQQQLVVPGLWWISSPDGAEEGRRILDLQFLRARDGARLRQRRASGGCSSLALVDPESARLLIVTITGAVLRAEHGSDGPRIRCIRRREGGQVAIEVRDGPAPAAATLLEADVNGGRHRLTTFDGALRTLAEASIRAQGNFPTRHFSTASSDVLLLRGADLDVTAFDARLRARWRIGGGLGSELDRVAPVAVDFDGDGRPELAIIRRFEAFALVDPASGRVKDEQILPGASLLLLQRARMPGEGDVLLASYRDRGVFALRSPRGDRGRGDRTARDLLAAIGAAAAP